MVNKTGVSGLITFVLGAIWPPLAPRVWEFCRSVFYEWAWQVIDPHIPTPSSFQLAPSAALVALGLFLFWRSAGSPRFWEKLTPIQAAARRVYSETENLPYGRYVTHTNQTENMRLSLVITAIYLYSQGVCGRRPPSENFTSLTAEDFKHLILVDGTNNFKQLSPPQNVVFEDVSVRNVDLKKYIKWASQITDRDLQRGLV